MLLTVEPDMPLESDRVVRTESPVTSHTLDESRVSDAEVIDPERVVPFRSVAEIELMESAVRDPVSDAPSAINVASPPFEPLVPQSPALALRSVPALFLTVVPVRVMAALVLVT